MRLGCLLIVLIMLTSLALTVIMVVKIEQYEADQHQVRQP